MVQSIRHFLPLARSWAAYAVLPAAGLITAPILAHALGPEGRGQLAGMLQPLVLASAIAALGVPSAVTFFIGRGVQAGRVSEIAVRISALLTLFVAVGLFFYSYTVAQQIGVDRNLMLLVWLAFLPSAFISISRARLQGIRRYGVLDLERVLASVLRVGLIAILWAGAVSNVFIYSAVYMASGLIASSVLLFSTQVRAKSVAHSREVELPASEMARYALFASFGTVATAVSARLDQAIMPAAVSPIELGYFSVAVAVAEVANIITTVAIRNVLAEVSSKVSLRSILRSVLIGGACQFVLILIILSIIPLAVPILFGSDFSPASDLIRVLLIGSFVAYWSNVTFAFLSGLGRPGLSSIGPASGVASTIFLFWFFWNDLTANIAAWISVVSQSTMFIAGMFLTGWVLAMRRDLWEDDCSSTKNRARK
ncbi:O-antigen/teichoic acid export membrane protein [Rhodoligotrophos appendicifer]|uniref:oligosaccharide flippase family protein n=1 Tax=Rhodoligotrophos appendicifer TaxID=987056 RepID=UPI001184DCA7|nr:oligosaccharide flippase family protein [Rhodoligotrophos appendicifer]